MEQYCGSTPDTPVFSNMLFLVTSIMQESNSPISNVSHCFSKDEDKAAEFFVLDKLLLYIHAQQGGR